MKKIISQLVIISFFLASCGGAKETETEAVRVRGVWLTNVDSKALNSKENIIETVKLCNELGFNTIFVVTWNKAMTTFPSKVVKQLTGVEIDTMFTGRDPLRELIDEAHKNNIKVFAWFEFGFSSSYNQNGGILLKAKPEWAAKDSAGNLVKKNNFEWMNGFNPEVQNFMLSLIMEVVNNYDVDGIQGDDRLPAMPSEAGYDEYTVNLYKQQHNGIEPPKYSKDSTWLQWRADLLTDFMRRIYETVKAAKQNVIVSVAPSIYPWSKEEYLQDWTAWVEKGYVDLICPQLYRYETERYFTALDDIVDRYISEKNLYKFYPGILLKVGSYYASKDYIKKVVAYNRSKGINGEVFFFFEGLKKYHEFFRDSLYHNKVKFPQLLKTKS
ncbi:MAG: family 10 glycosylhydrolase [Ignavibacteriaceae bacterium]|nr:family 10 glycosylhydrolase [Ignavibacteriaceae bacterium]